MIAPRRFFVHCCTFLVIVSLSAGCFPGGDVGPRPAANLVTVVEAYLQQHQPGPLPRLFQTTSLYDRNGVLLAEVFPEGRRTWVSLAGVSPHLINATIATEDASFYQNTGIDPRRIASALWQNTGSQEIVSGASTITMQLARNLFMGAEQRYNQTLDRKLQEAGIAQELTDLYSKDEILEMYLNLLNYSNLNYGPEAASHFYFGKPARDLTLAEATMLAGIPQRPADLDPLTNLEGVKQRQRVVLDLMVRHGYLTAQEADKAYAEPLHFHPGANAAATNPAPHFTQYVLDTLGERLGQDYVRRAGLRIITTLDLGLQTLAQQVVAEQVAQLGPTYHMNNAALVALKPGSAEILAMVGSANFYDEAIDGQVNVAVRKRQPGSAIKPLLYATAFDSRLISPASVLWDLPVRYQQADGQIYEPANYDDQFHGPVTARTALANSYNIPAVKLLAAYGVAPMLSRLRDMGLTSLDQTYDWYGLSLALGGGEVTLLDITAGYHTLANQGRRQTPQVLRALVDGHGQTVTPDLLANATQVLSPEAAFLVTDILSDNMARAPMFGTDSPLRLSRPAAAKTGTTNDLRDNWTVGYTRYLVAGVWAGNSDGQPMQGATGVSGAAPIWHTFMEAVLADPVLLATLDAPSDPESWRFTPPTGIWQLVACPPGLHCRQDGEYFTNAWIQSGARNPLYDSVVRIAASPVSVHHDGQWKQVGFCRVATAAEGSPVHDVLLLLQDSAGVAMQQTTMPSQTPALPVPEPTVQERTQALLWSIRNTLPLHLGDCANVEQTLHTYLPPAEHENLQIVVGEPTPGVASQ